MNLISEQKARDRLQLRQHTLKRLRRLGQGPAWVRIGRVVFYDLADLETWVRSCTTTPQNSNSTPSNEGYPNA